MKTCASCRHFVRYYSIKKDDLPGIDGLNYEGVGRCTNKKSKRCDYIEADFRKCEKHSAIKSK